MIRFLNAKGNKPIEIHRQLIELYGNDIKMDINHVRKWCREFSAGRTEIHDEGRSGQPLTSDVVIAKIEEKLREHQKVTLLQFPDFTILKLTMNFYGLIPFCIQKSYHFAYSALRGDRNRKIYHKPDLAGTEVSRSDLKCCQIETNQLSDLRKSLILKWRI